MTEDAPFDEYEAHPSDAYVQKAQARLASAANGSPPAAPQTEVVHAVPSVPAPGASPAVGEDALLSLKRPKKARRKRKRAVDAACEAGGTPDAAAEPGEEASAEDASLRGSHSSGDATPQPGESGAQRSGGADVAIPRATGTRDSSSLSAAISKPLPAPVGVVVVADDASTARAPEMQRLLRAPRYFDDDFEEAAKRCFNCGGAGHMSRDCPNAERARPCFLCARFGHDRANCPNQLCYKCQRPGHVARDCPDAASAPAWGAPGARGPGDAAAVCLRCGRHDCAAAGQGDFVRCGPQVLGPRAWQQPGA